MGQPEEPAATTRGTAPNSGSAAPPTEPSLGDLERFVVETVAGLAPLSPGAESRGRGRPRVLPSVCLWTGLLLCVLRGLESYRSVWRLLLEGRIWHYPRFPLSDEAVYRRLDREGTGPLEQLFAQVSAVLAHRLAPYALSNLAPFAAMVVALDQTSLDQVARLLPALAALPVGDSGLLPGQVAGLFDLRRQQWHRLRLVADPHANEKVVAREMVAELPRGSLILADLGYFAFAWFDTLTAQGSWWISRLRQRTSSQVLHTFYQQGDTFDGLVWLGAYRADRAQHAVRLVRFAVNQQQYTYLTNVLDPRQLPLADIARLYARRWDIELAFNLVKTHLKLHLLWSAKPQRVYAQVWAVFLLSQILQALRLEIAGRAGVDPFDVSMPLLVQYAPRYAAEGRDPIAVFVEFGRALAFIRPSRRTVIHAPTIPDPALVPLPPGTPLARTPRYGHITCPPRRRPKTPHH
jgi:Transposase DDE domain